MDEKRFTDKVQEEDLDIRALVTTLPDHDAEGKIILPAKVTLILKEKISELTVDQRTRISLILARTFPNLATRTTIGQQPTVFVDNIESLVECGPSKIRHHRELIVQLLHELANVAIPKKPLEIVLVDTPSKRKPFELVLTDVSSRTGVNSVAR